MFSFCSRMKTASEIWEKMGTRSEDEVKQVLRLAGLKRTGRFPVKAAVEGDGAENRFMLRCLGTMGCTVTRTWEKGIPAFSVSAEADYLTARDESGTILMPEQLLTAVCLIEMEHGCGKVAVPDDASAAVDLVAAGFGRLALRPGRDGAPARQLYARLPWLWDGVMGAVRICSRLSLTGERLEELMDKTPRFTAQKREVPLNCDGKQVVDELARGFRRQTKGCGLRLQTGGGWVYLQPSPLRQAVEVMAESADMEAAGELCDLYVRRVELADRELNGEKGGNKDEK